MKHSPIFKALEHIKDVIYDMGPEEAHLHPLFGLEPKIADLIDVLASVRNTIIFDSRDYSQNRRDFWLYGCLVGWDWDTQLEEHARKLGLYEADIRRLKKYSEVMEYFRWEKT